MSNKNKSLLPKNTRKQKLANSLLNSLLPILAAFALGSVLVALIGANPLATFGQMIALSLFEPSGLMRTLHVAAPLVLTGLAIAITFKANIFNMGVEGQMLLGGFFAGIVGSRMQNLPPLLHIGLCLLVAMVSGMTFALIPAILKAYFRVNEMVVTLMLNYVAAEFLIFLSEGVFRDTTAGYVATPTVQATAMFNKMFGTDLTPFIFIAAIAFVIVWFIFRRGKLGYEIEAIGKNIEFAEATGMMVRRKIIIMMLISGAISGLAGAGWMLSERFRYSLGFSGSPGLGWDGMLISLLGAHSPVGVLLSALFYSALKVGMSKIELFSNVPKEIVSVIQGLMILFLSVKYLKPEQKLRKFWKRGAV